MPQFRGRIYDDITQTVGATPLVRIRRLAADAGCVAEIVAKLEFFNPLSSVKDRIGVAMIEAAERDGKIGPETVIVEPSSGNTGIGLAFACAAKGYRCIIVMPDSMSVERRQILALLGATVELTPGPERIKGSIRRARELLEELPDAYMPMQFENPANPDIHKATTAEDIWADTHGRVDVFVAGSGTGGTITGTSAVLKARNPDLHVVAVEPAGSPVISGGAPGQHAIQGMGPGFIPAILRTELIDEIVQATDDESFAMARECAAKEGIPVGISSGAALTAALSVGARPEMAQKRIVVVLASSAERYLSTPLFNELDR
ncbi:MAG: cysteine synthase A [Alphaproteobacteria bacterium]|nr:cysteine synthase A [Alphaproteobacteria bacterium]